MKYEDFIKLLEEVKASRPGEKLEVVVYDDLRRGIEPVVAILPIGNTKKIVIM